MADPLTSQDRKDIHAFYEGWISGVLSQDWERMLEMYADDAVVMPPNHPVVRGKEAMREFMRSFPRVTRAEFEVDEVDGYGDIAYVTGRYSMTLQPEGAPGPIEDRGKYIEVRRKQADGFWLLSRDIFNSDLQQIGS